MTVYLCILAYFIGGFAVSIVWIYLANRSFETGRVGYLDSERVESFAALLIFAWPIVLPISFVVWFTGFANRRISKSLADHAEHSTKGIDDGEG